MAITITFKAKTGDPFNEIIKDIKDGLINLKEEVNKLGGETALQMILSIQGSKKRPQNGEPSDLEKNINCDFFDDGWGVGDVNLLKENAPYWAAVNWGSDHMVGKSVPNGFFSPGNPQPDFDAFRSGRWNVGTNQGEGIGEGRKHWSFIVQNAIPAMNYIESTVFWLSDKFDNLKITK